MSSPSSIAASSASFHFSTAQTSTATSATSDSQSSPVSPTDASKPSSSLPGLSFPTPSPSLLISAPLSHEEFEFSTPLYSGQQVQLQTRPASVSLSNSFSGAFDTTDALVERQRRVSYGGGSDGGEVEISDGDIWGTPAPRVVRAASDGSLLGAAGVTGRVGIEQPEKDSYDQERAALFREHERRSLENTAAARLSTAYGNSPSSTLPVSSAPTPTSLFLQQQQMNMLQKQRQQIHSSLAPLHSPTSPPLASPLADLQQSQAQEAQAQSLAITHAQVHAQASEGRFESASLHLGDLDAWMDEAYVRECCARMGWDGVTNVKMIRGASPSSGYCFLTFPSAAHAAQVLARFAASPPTLMPRSARTFKLNWGTGLPGVQPRWEGEYSVFVGDLGREVGETELVSLFTPLFPSTKSAKIMYDPSTGISRGYGFVRFADDSDMQRALLLGQNAGSGLSLHGRTLRISEASGPGNAVDGSSRERTRNRSAENLSIQTGGGAQYNANGAYGQQGQHRDVSPTSPYHPDFLSPTFSGSNFAPPVSPGAYSNHSNNNSATRSAIMGGGGGGGGGGAGGALGGGANGGGPASPAPHTTDPNNTTVFVGGLPACISEETLKSFFHHFGDITYCKIPTGKGCGFVQFVRRVDAELAIVKMNDFPIHGKSRIRLSWGRSQGDKQVEQVRKLASALGVPFEAVWRMVQGQDNTTIKQIATAVGETPVLGGRFESLGVGRMELGAVASAAGLTEAEVLELVGGRASTADGFSGAGNSSSARSDADFFPRPGMSGSVASLDTSLSSGGGSGGGPYSRVSPSTFSAFSGPRSGGQPQNLLPLSPPPSAGEYSQNQLQYQQQAHLQQNNHPSQQQGYGGASSPYNSIRPDSYLVPSPSSPYERVDFAEGGIRGGDRFQSQHQQHQPLSASSTSSYQAQQQRQPYSRYVGQSGYSDSQSQQPYLNNHQAPPHQQQQQQHPSPYQSNGYEQHQSERAYTTLQPPRQQGSIESSFANLSFSSPPLPPRTNNSSANIQSFASPTSDFFPSITSNGNKVDDSHPRAYLSPSEDRIGGGAQWGNWAGAHEA